MTTTTLDDVQVEFAPGASFAPPGLDLSRDGGRRIAIRLDELTKLSVAWDGADARPVDRRAVVIAGALIAQALRAGLPEPKLFPVPDGGLQIEWHAGPVELEIEIEPEGRGGVFVCDDEQVGQPIDGELPADLSRFALALARLNGYA